MKTTLDVNVPFDIATGQMTPKRSAAQANNLMSQMSQQYANLSTDEKAMWNLANNHVQSPTDPLNNTKRGANGWTLYYTCCMALLDTEQPLQRTPAPVSVPQNLPPIRVDISYAGVGNTPVINLIPNTAYAAGPTIVLWATPVVPLGNGSTTVFRARAYRKIGTITGGIPVGGVNVASQFLSVFPSVPRSCKIGFKLQAVNPGGYHSLKEFAVGLTPMVTLAAFGEGDGNLHLAAGE